MSEDWWSKKENVEKYVKACFDYQTMIFQKQHEGSPLSPNKLLELSFLSLSNAFQFLTDAVALFERESYAHSLALSVFGLEELGKSMYCYLAHKGWVKMGEFHQYMRRHEMKLEVMRSLDGIQMMRNLSEEAEKNGKSLSGHEIQLNPVYRRQDTWWRKLSKLRMKSLYVDYESAKSSPISRKEALEIIAKSRMYALGVANTVLAVPEKKRKVSI
jgi:AbiV family abortive infection protein